jgi:hypothetical protein
MSSELQNYTKKQRQSRKFLQMTTHTPIKIDSISTASAKSSNDLDALHLVTEQVNHLNQSSQQSKSTKTSHTKPVQIVGPVVMSSSSLSSSSTSFPITNSCKRPLDEVKSTKQQKSPSSPRPPSKKSKIVIYARNDDFDTSDSDEESENDTNGTDEAETSSVIINDVDMSTVNNIIPLTESAAEEELVAALPPSPPLLPEPVQNPTPHINHDKKSTFDKTASNFKTDNTMAPKINHKQITTVSSRTKSTKSQPSTHSMDLPLSTQQDIITNIVATTTTTTTTTITTPSPTTTSNNNYKQSRDILKSLLPLKPLQSKTNISPVVSTPPPTIPQPPPPLSSSITTTSTTTSLSQLANPLVIDSSYTLPPVTPTMSTMITTFNLKKKRILTPTPSTRQVLNVTPASAESNVAAITSDSLATITTDNTLVTPASTSYWPFTSTDPSKSPSVRHGHNIATIAAVQRTNADCIMTSNTQQSRDLDTIDTTSAVSSTSISSAKHEGNAPTIITYLPTYQRDQFIQPSITNSLITKKIIQLINVVGTTKKKYNDLFQETINELLSYKTQAPRLPTIFDVVTCKIPVFSDMNSITLIGDDTCHRLQNTSISKQKKFYTDFLNAHLMYQRDILQTYCAFDLQVQEITYNTLVDVLTKIYTTNRDLFQALRFQYGNKMLQFACCNLTNFSNMALLEWSEAVLLTICANGNTTDFAWNTWSYIFTNLQSTQWHIAVTTSIAVLHGPTKTLSQIFITNHQYKIDNCQLPANEMFVNHRMPPVNTFALNNIIFPLAHTIYPKTTTKLDALNGRLFGNK